MKCFNCNELHLGDYGSGKFCSVKCARSYSTKNKRQEINKKVSVSMTGKKLSNDHKEKCVAVLMLHGKNVGKRKTKFCRFCNCEMICVLSDNRKYCSQQCWIDDINKSKSDYALYVKKCKFDFNVYNYPHKFNLNLIEEFNWYKASNRGNNLNGISMDHMLSIREGFDLNVDPELIKHPANCELMQQYKNSKKRTKSSITLDELKNRINSW